MTIEENLLKGFKEVYGDEGEIRGYMAPGRVNLIGEHIDYNGGHVFPCALTVGNYAIVRKRNDDKIRFYSANYKKGGIYNTSLSDLVYSQKAFWTNYPKGVMWTFEKYGYKITHGFDIYIWGNIPGSGLSSSAAMEVVMAVMLKDYFHFDVDGIKIAQMTQYSENNFNNMNCGIMDQFASSMGKKDMAIYLDCATLKYDYIPLVLKGYKIIVINSNKPHSLASSHYNDRRKECEYALKCLQKSVKIDSLCQLTPEEFSFYQSNIPDSTARSRAYFAVNEENRTKLAVKALKANDIETFGSLISESGDGLRFDYDATCKEIDILVDAAKKQKGCVGSRETGGGWGGNTISIVKEEDVDAFINNVKEKYKSKTGLEAGIHELDVGDGGRRLF